MVDGRSSTRSGSSFPPKAAFRRTAKGHSNPRGPNRVRRRAENSVVSRLFMPEHRLHIDLLHRRDDPARSPEFIDGAPAGGA